MGRPGRSSSPCLRVPRSGSCTYRSSIRSKRSSFRTPSGRHCRHAAFHCPSRRTFSGWPKSEAQPCLYVGVDDRRDFGDPFAAVYARVSGSYRGIIVIPGEGEEIEREAEETEVFELHRDLEAEAAWVKRATELGLALEDDGHGLRTDRAPVWGWPQFLREAVAALRAEGWKVTVDSKVPIAPPPDAWYLDVEESTGGWFDLKLGHRGGRASDRPGPSDRSCDPGGQAREAGERERRRHRALASGWPPDRSTRRAAREDPGRPRRAARRAFRRRGPCGSRGRTRGGSPRSTRRCSGAVAIVSRSSLSSSHAVMRCPSRRLQG